MSNGSLLFNGREIRQALGSTYEVISRYDQYKVNKRSIPPEYRRHLKKHYYCAICGGSPKTNKAIRKLQAAHIVAREECGEDSFDNILALCQRQNSLGCHQLYDKRGVFSIEEMRKFKKRWDKIQECNRCRDMRSVIEKRLEGDRLDKLQQHIINAEWKKALEEIDHKLSLDENSRGSQGYYKYSIRKIEVERRRTAQGRLKAAEDLFYQLKPTEIPYDAGSGNLLSRYFYEGAYVKLLMGDLRCARALFVKSRDSSATQIGKIIADGLLIQIDTAMRVSDKIFPKLIAKLNDLVSRVRRISQSTNDIKALRFKSNFSWYKVRLNTVKGDVPSAEKSVRQALSIWEKMHILSGWDAGFRPTVLAEIGKVIALKARKTGQKKESEVIAKKSLKYLSRSLHYSTSTHRTHPEGIRDSLIATAKALEILGLKKDAMKILNVLKRIKDGSSWDNAYFLEFQHDPLGNPCVKYLEKSFS